MKYYPETISRKLPNGISCMLDDIRYKKQFNAIDYIVAKTLLINQYFKENNLDTAVVAISGGIDSAVVLKLLEATKNINGSHLKKIFSITLPAKNCVGVTNQNDSAEKAVLIGSDTINLEHLVKELEETINTYTENKMSPWAQGQLIPYLRTSLLYSLTAALVDKGCRAIIVGTTNRDEGSYLGYIGKASDGLTDLQIISDLHKSEVYKIAKILNVPSDIYNKTPTGDMYDNRSDEEVFGAPYDFVELYTTLLHKYQKEYLELNKIEEYLLLDHDEKSVFENLSSNIVKLHNYNRHKYISCSPSIHLDITPFSFPGGWRNNTTFTHEISNIVDESKFNNVVSFNFTARIVPAINYTKLGHNIYKIENFLCESEIKELLENIEQNGNWMRANEYGKLEENIKIGSFRKSWYSKSFSKSLSNRLNNLPIKTYIPKMDIQDDESESIVWSFKEITSLFRFIKYKKGDSLVPHYDESYKVSNFSKTLFSIVIYLTEGATQFLNENRNNHNYKDFNKLSSELNMEPYLIAKCKPGDALIFQHRLLHDCPIVSDNKLIIRSDLLFSKPNLGGALNGY